MEVLLKSFSGPSLKLPSGICGADHSAAWGSSLLDRKVSIWGSNSTIEWNALLCMTSKQEMEEGGDFHLSCPLHLELNLGMHSILPWWVSFKWIPNRSKTTELSMSQLSELCLTPTRCIRLVCCPSQCDWWRIKARWRHRSQFHPEAFNSLHKIASPWPSLLMDPLCERSWYIYIALLADPRPADGQKWIDAGQKNFHSSFEWRGQNWTFGHWSLVTSFDRLGGNHLTHNYYGDLCQYWNRIMS